MFLGIDIGTTSISAVVVDDKGKILRTITEKNNSQIVTNNKSRIQDVSIIINNCKEIVNELTKKYRILTIGISNQMHGILYIDKDCNALSPLFTWQDERGNEQYNESTYVRKISEITGYNLSTGFGTVSYYYDVINDGVPKNTAYIVTIGDYLSLALTNSKRPLMHSSNAASLGLFDIKKCEWDTKAIEKAGLNVAYYPKVSKEVNLVGKYQDTINVYTAIGDNQASVYGTTKDNSGVVLNYGTGSQITFIIDKYYVAPLGCEIRPYFENKYLLIGGALCGGYAYQILKNFFSKVCGKAFDYEIMNHWAESVKENDLPIVETKFKGERHNPTSRAIITNLNETNFTPEALTYAFLRGMSKELKDFYDQIIKVVGEREYLIGTGNGVRLNPTFQKIIQKDYKLPLFIPEHLEEAAYGVAILTASIIAKKSFKKYIKYKSLFS